MSDIGERRTANYTTSESLKKKIEVAKLSVKDKYAICRSSARKLVAAYEALALAEEKRDLNGSRKTHSKCLVCEHKYNLAKDNYIDDLARYDESVSEVDEVYNELISMAGEKESRRMSREADKFDRIQSALRNKLALIVNATGESFDERAEETLRKYQDITPSPQKEEEPEKIQKPIAEYNNAPRGAGVGIAPMSIDISHIVEEAVSVAMEKFKAAFIKEADAFIESLPKEGNAEGVSQNDEKSLELETVAETEEAILDEEKNIVLRLKELMEKLTELQNQMTELGALYIDVSNKQKDAADAQRKINDLQRTIAREIQGVQANQKVINQEQSEVYAEQTLFIEKQKASLEGQKALIEAQNGILEMQKTTVESQAALEESIGEIIRSHKEMIASQQTLINQNSKNIEAQEELTKRQSEVTAMQKDAMAKQKQAARAQKSLT